MIHRPEKETMDEYSKKPLLISLEQNDYFPYNCYVHYLAYYNNFNRFLFTA